MKKYRVVRAYLRRGVTVSVGTIIEIYAPVNMFVTNNLSNAPYKLSEADETALSLGALEEVKAWEPKDNDIVYYSTPLKGGCYNGFFSARLEQKEFEMGLIYPTREQAEECRKRMLEAARKYKEEVLG